MSGRIGIRNEAASESGKGVNSEDAKTRSGNLWNRLGGRRDALPYVQPRGLPVGGLGTQCRMAATG
jgi:hypothetical protein